MLNIIIFVLLFLVTANWFQLMSFLSLFIGSKIKTSSIKDKWIQNIVKKKTGLTLPDIILFHDKKMYGMMVGLPFWPKMILSTGLYNSFNKDELEWVILHEAGHCILWHNLEAFIIELVALLLGIYLIKITEMNILLVILLSILLSLVCIQIIRWLIEYAADKYSINRVDDPRGVITAQEKFRKNYYKNPFSDDKSILRFLLYWNITRSQRIKMAQALLH